MIAVTPPEEEMGRKAMTSAAPRRTKGAHSIRASRSKSGSTTGAAPAGPASNRQPVRVVLDPDERLVGKGTLCATRPRLQSSRGDPAQPSAQPSRAPDRGASHRHGEAGRAGAQVEVHPVGRALAQDLRIRDCVSAELNPARPPPGSDGEAAVPATKHAWSPCPTSEGKCGEGQGERARAPHGHSLGQRPSLAYTSVMADTARKAATYEDVLAAPPHMVAQIVEGELVLSPRPASRHAAAASTLSEELGPPFKRGRGGPGGWLIVYEPELHLADNILVLDLAGWRRARMPLLPDAPFLTMAPDWICEVLSPGSARFDRGKKMPLYGQAGVGNAWLLDPEERTLEVYRLIDARWSLLATCSDDQRVRAEPFDAIELDLSILWADVEPPAK